LPINELDDNHFTKIIIKSTQMNNLNVSVG